MAGVAEVVLSTAPRILGLIDRQERSETYGCCDRYYWHYRLHDLSNARFQEACLFLAILYTSEFEGNLYHRRASVLDWSLACIEYWMNRLASGGYCAEVYPYERSYCATAFSSFAVTETLLLFTQGDSAAQEKARAFLAQGRVQDIFRRVGRWIMGHPNHDVANQLAAGAASLANLSLLTSEPGLQEGSDAILRRLRTDFDEFGYAREYGGLDIGYLSITHSLLAWMRDRSVESNGPPPLAGMMEKTNARLDPLIDAWGNYDPRGTSRNTQFLYPYGFYRTGSPIFGRITKGIEENRIITPSWMDDRYCVALAVDYAKVLHEGAGRR